MHFVIRVSLLPLTLIGVLIHELINESSLFLIMVDEEVYHLVYDLGEKNGTMGAAKVLVQFLEKNGDLCKEDYEKTSRELRFSSGKIEKAIFKLLAMVVNKQNKNGNAQKASHIMFLLGYKSYMEKSHRFRQKMENLLKNERKKQKDAEKKQKKDTDKKTGEKGGRRRKQKPSIQLSTDSDSYSEVRDDTVSSAESPVLSPNNTIQPTLSSINSNMPLPNAESLENSATGSNSTAETTDMESMEEREPSPIPLDQSSYSNCPMFPAPVNAAVSVSASEMFNRRQEPTFGLGITTFGFSSTMDDYDDMYMKQDDCLMETKNCLWETEDETSFSYMNGYPRPLNEQDNEFNSSSHYSE